MVAFVRATLGFEQEIMRQGTMPWVEPLHGPRANRPQRPND
jgi:hypothetical protein